VVLLHSTSCTKAISRGHELTTNCKYAIVEKGQTTLSNLGFANAKNRVYRDTCNAKWKQIRDKQ